MFVCTVAFEMKDAFSPLVFNIEESTYVIKLTYVISKIFWKFYKAAMDWSCRKQGIATHVILSEWINSMHLLDLYQRAVFTIIEWATNYPVTRRKTRMLFSYNYQEVLVCSNFGLDVS